MSNMNKSQKPSQPVARQQMAELSEEEKKAQFMRAYMQKKASLAEAILFNIVQSCGRDLCYDIDNKTTQDNPQKIVKIANDMADEFMKVVYHQEVTIKEEE